MTRGADLCHEGEVLNNPENNGWFFRLNCFQKELDSYIFEVMASSSRQVQIANRSWINNDENMPPEGPISFSQPIGNQNVSCLVDFLYWGWGLKVLLVYWLRMIRSIVHNCNLPHFGSIGRSLGRMGATGILIGPLNAFGCHIYHTL